MKKYLVTVVVMASLSLASTAQAGKNAEARKAFMAGRAAFKAGEYAKAATMLKKAYTLKPHPALLRYLGQTFYKMNKAREAIRYFKRYLKDAPKAPDRAKVQAKVRELEMVVGANDDDDDDKKGTAPPPPPPAPAKTPKAAPPPGKAKSNIAPPTGEDNEIPDDLQARRRVAQQKKADADTDSGSSGSALSWLKWVTAGLAVGGIAMGATFAGLGSSDASKLQDAVATSNPTGNSPTVQFSKQHFDLQEGIKQKRTISIISFVGGGVAAAVSVIFFVMDSGSKNERKASKKGTDVAIAPVIGGGLYGVSGVLRF